jgi:vancomycin resistance protein YoaR
MVAQDGRLVLHVDGAALAAAVTAAAPTAVTAPTDAHVDVTSGAPVVVPAVDGTRIDPDALATAATAALRGTDARARTLTAPLVPAPPDLTTADVQALGITQPLAEAATALTADAARTANAATAAAAADGWLLLPGGTFSLADALGTPSPETGYTAAAVVHDGRVSSAFDTGVPQLAATLYDAALRAGLTDAGHTPHPTYDARYPEGREATVALPGQDLRLTAPGPHGVLVQAWVGDGQLHVRLWGTADAQVVVTTGPRTAVVRAATRVDASAGCVPVSPQDGFDVTVTRTTTPVGAAVTTDATTTHYAPRTGVVCTAPADPAAPPLLAVGD